MGSRPGRMGVSGYRRACFAARECVSEHHMLAWRLTCGRVPADLVAKYQAATGA
jgi:hypothetical protein